MQAYQLELLQQVSSTLEIFHVLLLELYMSDKRSAPVLSLPIELVSDKEHELGWDPSKCVPVKCVLLLH